MKSHWGSQCCKAWKQWWICTKWRKNETLSSTGKHRSPQKRWIWGTLEKNMDFLCRKSIFPKAVVAALAQLCTDVAVGCSRWLMLAVILCFQHALLIWDHCQKALIFFLSALKGLWIDASSHPGCTRFTLWRVGISASPLCFTSSFTLRSHSGTQSLTEGSADQHKWINFSSSCQK